MLFSIGVSLFDWNGISGAEFAGFSNYGKLFTDVRFWNSLLVTLAIILPAIPLQIGIGLLIAFLLWDFLRKYTSLVRILNFLPYLIIPFAIGILFQYFFDRKIGFVNRFLLNVGLADEPIGWLTHPVLVKLVVIFLLVWRYYGYMAIILIASLQTIPDSLSEAAQIDGASWHHRLFHIVIPLLRPVLIFLSVTSIIGGLQLFDEPVAVMTYSKLPFGGHSGCRSYVTDEFLQHFFSELRIRLWCGQCRAYVRHYVRAFNRTDSHDSK